MNIKYPGKYIIKKNKDNDNNIIIEQYVTIYGIHKDINDNVKYDYIYGHIGFHEGVAYIENIRELTKQEWEYSNNKQVWKLPQQFYKSCLE
jgi:hypothetical protein